VRHLRIALATALTAVLVISATASAASYPLTDATAAGGSTAKGYALVQLKGSPLSTYARTRPAQGKKIDFSSDAVKSRRALLAAERNQFKKWLKQNAPKAKVVGSYDIALNAVSVKLNGTGLKAIRQSPLVVRAQLQGLYHPTADDPDLALISAVQAWEAAGQTAETAGDGVMVGVIDTGIDVTHPCFSDGDYPEHPQLGDQRFTNNKVVVARVFYNKAKSRGFTAEAIGDHGTHVAGTIACNYDTAATVNGVDIPYGISGVAPRALLGSYNVFPADVENARSEDILNAIEAAYVDGMDVVNMSLGGPASGIKDLLTMAVDNLDKAGMVFAISAGNEGPGHYTVGSPGSASRALTAGASTVPHFVGAPLSVDGATYGVAAGDFPIVDSDLMAPVGVAFDGSDLSNACAALPADSLAGDIAIISRGACTFSQKIRNAQDAGAVAAIVVNNVAGDPVAMALGGIANEPTIPAYMASLADRDALMAADGMDATLGADNAYFSTTNADIMAGFSSQGPTDVDFRVKPDVVAPGVNVLSSIPQSYCDKHVDCFAFFQGTSMASPHLAGAAAIVKQAHPDWPAWAIRSAIVNTADTGRLTDYRDGTTVVTDVNVTGAGIANVESAVNATALIAPVSISFGATPSGSGQTRSVAVTVLNGGDAAVEWSVGIEPYGSATGVHFATSVSSLTLGAGESATFKVQASFLKKVTKGDKQAWLVISDGSGVVAHAAVYARVK
jgi:minor extracellular serine protease Vpr